VTCNGTISPMQPVTIRAATASDVPQILQFIQKKAAFDATMGNFDGTIETTEHAIHHTLFGAKPFAHVLFATCGGEQPTGFALYYFRYSSFKGRPSIWLDDLYVDESMRSRKLGAGLMRQLASEAIAHGCTDVAWTASARNAAGIRFYLRLGATQVDERDNLLFFRVNAAALLASAGAV
jgi:GNAT superfamily N-acetyltransferase